MNITIDKTALVEAIQDALGDAYRSFAEKSKYEFTVGTAESLNDSGWSGKWTEILRSEIAKFVPQSTVICVKPVPCKRFVYYRIIVCGEFYAGLKT